MANGNLINKIDIINNHLRMETNKLEELELEEKSLHAVIKIHNERIKELRNEIATVKNDYKKLLPFNVGSKIKFKTFDDNVNYKIGKVADFEILDSLRCIGFMIYLIDENGKQDINPTSLDVNPFSIVVIER
jgi:hypothetical protein